MKSEFAVAKTSNVTLLTLHGRMNRCAPESHVERDEAKIKAF
jgi:hypothetical protein